MYKPCVPLPWTWIRAKFYMKNALLRNAPASTTKMMTAIVTVENSNLDDIVTISRKRGMDGSVMGLYTGQQLTVKELLYGLLLCSGNDAAVALAEHIGGDMESFARLMNEKAEELGLKDTHFVNSHGLDAEGHYSNAYELAKIGAYALSHDIIKEIVGTKFAHIAGRNLTNTNELLGYYEGVYGLKTGLPIKREDAWLHPQKGRSECHYGGVEQPYEEGSDDFDHSNTGLCF